MSPRLVRVVGLSGSGGSAGLSWKSGAELGLVLVIKLSALVLGKRRGSRAPGDQA